MKKQLIMIALLCLVAVPAAADLLITEVYYDHPLSDDTYEWVEILNTSSIPIDLAGYFLAWGGTDYSYGTLMLEGSIPACATFVVGGPAGESLVFDLAVDFDPDIQNGGSASDAVALFAPGADALTDMPIDAVIYDSPNTNGLIDETGAIGVPDVDDAPAGFPIVRVSFDGDWEIGEFLDPGVVTFEYECGGVVPSELQTWGNIKSLYR